MKERVRLFHGVGSSVHHGGGHNRAEQLTSKGSEVKKEFDYMDISFIYSLLIYLGHQDLG